MTRTLRCARDHEWQVAFSNVPLEQGNFFCPVCGATANREVGNTGSADSLKPTLPGYEAIATSNASQPRPQIPDFEVVGELGRGGMGIVYKAKQLSRNRFVAIKVIRKEQLANQEAVKRFRREAQVAAKLTHPNIVLLYDSDHVGDTHYLVMEYVAGMTFDHLVESQGPLSVAQACDYLRQAALGLQHASEQGLVHRDIKPSNLMVTWESALFDAKGARPKPPPPGEKRTGGVVKILDMGIARINQLSMADSLSTLTQTGSVLGTADYIAPEQLEDPRQADIRADLYSLGCTFYHLLTGQVPFPGGTLVQKLDKQRWDTAAGIEQFRTDVPPALTAIVRKLMAKKPADRYQTPGELAAALDRMLQSGFATVASAKLREVRRFLGHTATVLAATFSPDSRRIASAGKDGTIRLWDVETGQETRCLEKQPQEVRCVAFSPAGDRLLSASGVSLRLWNVSSGEVLTRFTGHSGIVFTAAFFPGGGRVASAGDDKTIRIWDIDTGRELQRFARHIAAITGIAFTPDGQHLLSGSRDQSLRLWDTRTGQEVRQLSVTKGQVLSVAISHDGHHALSAHFDTQLRLWDLQDGRELRRFPGHKQMVTAGVFTSDGRRIVSGSQDQTVRLWDVETGSELAVGAAHKGGVTHVAAAPDGRHVVSTSVDQSLCLWQLPE